MSYEYEVKSGFSKSELHDIFKSLPVSVFSMFYSYFKVKDITIQSSDAVSVLGDDKAIEEFNKMLMSVKPVIMPSNDSEYKPFQELNFIGVDNFTVKKENRYLIFPNSSVTLVLSVPSISFLFNILKYFYFINIGLVWHVEYGFKVDYFMLNMLLNELYPEGVFRYKSSNPLEPDFKSIKIDELLNAIMEVIEPKRLRFLVYKIEITPTSDKVTLTLNGTEVVDYLFSYFTYPFLISDVAEFENAYALLLERMKDKKKKIDTGDFSFDYTNIAGFLEYGNILVPSKDRLKERYREFIKIIDGILSELSSKSNKLISTVKINGKEVRCFKYSIVSIMYGFSVFGDLFKNFISSKGFSSWVVDISDVDIKDPIMAKYFIGINKSGNASEHKELILILSKILKNVKKSKGTISFKNFISTYVQEVNNYVNSKNEKNKPSTVNNKSIKKFVYFFIKRVYSIKKEADYNIIKFVVFNSGNILEGADLVNKSVKQKGLGDSGDIISVSNLLKTEIFKLMSEKLSQKELPIFIDLLFDTKTLILSDSVSMSVASDNNMRNILISNSIQAAKNRLVVDQESGGLSYEKSDFFGDKKSAKSAPKKEDGPKNYLTAFLPMEFNATFVYFSSFDIGESLVVYYGPLFSYSFTIVEIEEELTSNENLIKTRLRLIRT